MELVLVSLVRIIADENFNFPNEPNMKAKELNPADENDVARAKEA